MVRAYAASDSKIIIVFSRMHAPNAFTEATLQHHIHTTGKCDTCKDIVKAFYRKYKETDTIHFRGESKGWTLDNEKVRTHM